MKVLILYSELAGYFLSCINELESSYNVEINIINWPISNQAPFVFPQQNNIKIKQKNTFAGYKDFENYCLSFNPDIVYAAGWRDKQYLKLCKKLRKKGKIVIAAFDNQWHGTFKQYLATIAFPILYKRAFTHAWIPGFFQFEYARRLGFTKENILFGVYSCDQGQFYSEYTKNRELKKANYPKNFIFVGRFSPEKGAQELYETFQKLTDEERNGWKLIFIGTGPLNDIIKPSENIEVRGFLQPTELLKIIPEAGCLVFPSFIDPWGVSVHEFCSAGLPLLVSNVSGASTAFLKEGFNGFSLNGHDLSDLKFKLLKITKLSGDQLNLMGERSASISFQITPQIWASTLMNLKVNLNH